MMREERREPLTYKSFFHTNMTHEPYCMRALIVYTKNAFFFLLKWCLDNYSAQRVVELAELIYQAQTSPRKPKSMIISP